MLACALSGESVPLPAVGLCVDCAQAYFQSIIGKASPPLKMILSHSGES